MVRAVLRPALAAGRCVLLDRWFWSTLAYQGGGGGVPLELIERISAMATAGVRPDLVLLLDLDPGAGAARKRAKDRMEDRGGDFARRVRATYLELARREAAVTRIIDASRPFEAVFEDALRFVDGIVPPRGAPS
jgi:dTMP kinase